MDEADSLRHGSVHRRVVVHPARPKCAPVCDANDPCQIDRTEMSPIRADSESQADTGNPSGQVWESPSSTSCRTRSSITPIQ
jgi:hypothetical protein